METSTETKLHSENGFEQKAQKHLKRTRERVNAWTREHVNTCTSGLFKDKLQFDEIQT